MRGKPAARRTRDPEATREALIDAGTRRFAAHGFDGTRTEAIARDAGVNKAMINYHFGGKEGLYRAILASGFAEADARMSPIRESPADASAVDLLRGFVEAMAATFAHRPTLPLLIQREALAGGEALDREAYPYMTRILLLLDAIVRRGVDHGTFRPTHPMLVHFQIVGSLLLYFTTRPLRERLAERGDFPVALPSLDEMVRHVHESVARGLATEPGRTPAAQRRT